MISDEVKESICVWTNWASNTNVQRYDIALLKIWIKLEQFISDLFICYATGHPSEKGYKPRLKIQFQDEEQFNAFMREGGKTYIDYLDKIEKLSKHIFFDNPFDILISDSEVKPSFQQIKALRNYIAHESGTAKRKYINTCFSGDETKYMDPNVFLKSKEKTTKIMFYSYYVEIISNIVDLLIIDSDEGNHQDV